MFAVLWGEHMFVRMLIITAVAVIAWAVIARGSSATAPERVYVVKPADTLWTIAGARYGGDPRAAVWKIRHRNELAGTLIRPGQRLVLP